MAIVIAQGGRWQECSCTAAGRSPASKPSGRSTSSTSSVLCTPSATLVVSQSPSACEYGNITAAIAAMPNDAQPKTISIKAGIYTEQLSITRNGKVTLVGETDTPQDYTSNKVTIQFSNGEALCCPWKTVIIALTSAPFGR